MPWVAWPCVLTARVVSTETLISTALLGRARSIAAEHSKLSGLLVQNFDAKIAKKAGELSNVAAIVKQWEQTSEACLNTMMQLQSLY